MKRLISLLALLLLLCGCGSHDNSATESPETVKKDNQQPLTVYAMEEDFSSVIAMGENLLLCNQEELVLLSPETLEVVGTASLPAAPQNNDLQVGDNGLAYYDRSSQTVYFMDIQLQVVSFIQLPEETLGPVQLSRDWAALYYCTADGIQVLDLETGVTRLLVHKEAKWLGMTGSFLRDTVLQCRVEQDGGAIRTVMISAETGEILWQTEYDDGWWSNKGLYICSLQTAAGQEWIYGWGDGQPRNFWPKSGADVIPLVEGNAVLTVTTTESGAVMDYYLLNTGEREASLELDIEPAVDSAAWLNGSVWYLTGGKLCRWDTALSPCADDAVYATYHYNQDYPDVDGMNEQVQHARILEKGYGVNIILWDEAEAVQPESYDFTVEYVPENYEDGLAALEKALSKFPRQLLSQSAGWTESGKLNIVLVREVKQDAKTSVDGLQYLLNGDVYIVLDLDGAVEKTFYHTMGHVIDIVLLSNTKALYEWDKLNPSDFCYDNDYAANQERDGSKYLKGSKRYFINTFSMSYPVEDRATILEYAIQSGNSDCFESKYMRAKLEKVCEAIREAFGLTEERYIWEQYLN